MKRTGITAITLTAFFIFGASLVRAIWYTPGSEIAVPQLEGRAPIDNVGEEAHPSRLIVPSLQIDAHIQYVGIAASGNMAVPNNYTDVGWYRYGTVPGQKGSAVIDGHVDNALGLAGVFKNLELIEAGEEIFVETKGGKKLRFIVTDVERYGYKEVPNHLLFGREDAGRLNLITCGGSWIKREKTYDERIVVYSVLAQ